MSLREGRAVRRDCSSTGLMSEGTNTLPVQPGAASQTGKTEALAPKRGPRMVGLDVLRFIAVMMVLYAHANQFPATRKFFLGKFGLLYDALYALHGGCWVAIDLFFVLSGFLVSGLLFKELARTGDVSPSRFLVRRGFKIYPVFWLMLLATVIGLLAMGQPASLKTLFIELLFIQNYTIGPWPTYVPSYWGVTWSLGVEEHFYFMMAGLIWLLKRNCGPRWGAKIHALPKLFLCVAAGCIALRAIQCAVIPYDPRHKFLFQYATHARMDALFFGVLISYYWHNRWSDEFKNKLMDRRWFLAAGGLALLSTAIYREAVWFRVVGYVCTYLGSGYLMISLFSLDRSAPNFAIRAMAGLGRCSYSVYLWHMMAGFWLLPHIALRGHRMTIWTTNLFIYFVMCWTVGSIMSLLVEYPMLAVRDRFFPWLRERSGGIPAQGRPRWPKHPLNR